MLSACNILNSAKSHSPTAAAAAAAHIRIPYSGMREPENVNKGNGRSAQKKAYNNSGASLSRAAARNENEARCIRSKRARERERNDDRVAEE